MRANLNKNFGSSHDLKSSENKSNEKRQEKSSREMKKGRAPPPPLTSQNNNRIKVNTIQSLFKNIVQLTLFNIFLDDTTAYNAGSRSTNTS